MKMPKKKDAHRKCAAHPEMDVLFVCTDCDDDLVCSHCVTTTHSGHHLVEISEYVKRKKDSIENFLHEAEMELPRIANKIDSADRKLQGNSKFFLDVISEIEKHCETLKTEIDRITQNYINICKHLEEENNDSLAKHKQELKFIHENMSSLVKSSKDVMTTGTDIEIIMAEKKIPPLGGVPTDFPLRSAVFSPGHSSPEQRLRVFGTMIIDGEVSSAYSQASLRLPETLDVISEFDFSKNIHSLCPSGDQAWILERLKDEVVLVKQNGDVVRNLRCESRVNDISVSPSLKNLWLACEDRRIREVRTSTIPIVKFRVEDTPQCICCIDDDSIVIGMERKIAIFNSQGEVQQAMDKFSSLARMMKRPHHTAYCKRTGELAVVVNDNHGHSRCHITVVDGMLHLRYSFDGDSLTARNGTVRPAGHNAARSFLPFDVCYDRERNLLIADSNNKCILLLKHKGKQVRTLITEKLEPRALGLQNDGMLWVAFESGKVKVLRYKE